MIDHLGSDDAARQHFLRSCSVHGALLALSVAGGRRGDRELPLLRRDADWDALTGRLYDLVPEFEPVELIGLMDALRALTRDVLDASTQVEAEALATAVLSRVRSLWNTSRAPISIAGLEMWLTLAGRLAAKPDPPAMAMTWAELLPVAAPDLSDRATLERFADWLTLVELLANHYPDLLGGLGFPGHTPELCERFISSLEVGNERDRPCDVGQTLRALTSMPRVTPQLSDRAYWVQERLADLDDVSPPSMTSVGAPDPSQNTRHLDVRRVLTDL